MRILPTKSTFRKIILPLAFWKQELGKLCLKDQILSALATFDLLDFFSILKKVLIPKENLQKGLFIFQNLRQK